MICGDVASMHGVIPKKTEYYIWSIRFGSYTTGGEMTATKQKKITTYIRAAKVYVFFILPLYESRDEHD